MGTPVEAKLQPHRLLQDLATKIGTQCGFSQHMDPLTKQIFQVQDEACREPGGVFRANIHQQVDIAIRPRLSAHDRTENTYVAGAMP